MSTWPFDSARVRAMAVVSDVLVCMTIFRGVRSVVEMSTRAWGVGLHLISTGELRKAPAGAKKEAILEPDSAALAHAEDLP